ncbi:MAG: hypothetical protein HFI40_04745 [Lachnospiraceae bacterium]|nr:hypothetical protein [Lachnospiraceae bacterium]
MAKKSAATKVVLDITSMVLHLLLNIVFFIVVVMLVVKFSQIAYDFSYQVFGSVRVSEENGREYELTISEGESTMRVAAKLEQNRIIVNRFSFFLRAKLMKKNILPGTYNVNASMDYDEIYAVIAPAAQPN